jgi:hypothetical protein
MAKAKKRVVDDDSDAIDEEMSEQEHSDFEDASNGAHSEPEAASDASEVVKTPAKRKATSSKASTSPRKKAKGKKASIGHADDESSSEDEEEKASKYGVQKVKAKKSAPKEEVGHGQIGARTLDFLEKLTHEEFQDRDWFSENDAWYRQSWAQWNAFVDAVQPELQKADDTLPVLPARDLVHRIYRDVRFSANKRPYKTNLSASFSRAGRKGPVSATLCNL